MTPERIAELRADDDRHARDDDDTLILRVGLYRDLLAEAESAARLRGALTSVLTVIRGDLGVNGENCLAVRAAELALESKGGAE